MLVGPFFQKKVLGVVEVVKAYFGPISDLDRLLQGDPKQTDIFEIATTL